MTFPEEARLKGATIELPCPPYKYTANGRDLTIRSGSYTKTATREQWQEFLDEAQAQIDLLPEAFDLSWLTVGVSVKSSAIAQWDKTLKIRELVNQHDDYDAFTATWSGTKEALEDAIEGAIADLDFDDLPHDRGDEAVQWQEFGEREAEVEDIDYDLAEIPEDGA